jgi:hypothetical protein
MTTILAYIFCGTLMISSIALPIFFWKNDFAKDDEPKVTAPEKKWVYDKLHR